MKKLIFTCAALFAILLFGSLSKPDNNVVQVDTKDTKLSDWQWTSGEVEMKTTAAKQCFTILFNPAVYRPRDSVKIIFTSYKVALTNLDKGTTFGQWKGVVSLVYFINNNWIPIVTDTNDRINQPFSNRNNITTDSLKKYTLLLTVPLSRKYTITTSAISFEMDNKLGSPILSGGKLGVTLTTSIHGIEVEKIVRN
ncbi:MAG TPA: hypothetical protein VK808_07945 [Bacteroidia bacterium]|jgi:hypothetical protein|nr:hypothetical protein [Bacteroidia bacterium]